MPTNTIEKVLAEHGLTPETPSLDVLIFDEVNGTGISVIDLLEEVDEAARASERADIEGRNKIRKKYLELNDKDIVVASRAEGYKQGQIDAITHLFENKIAMVRAVKVLSEEMQDVAKKAGYKPDDVLFITMEKIEGGMVIKGSVAKCESDELVIKKVD